MLNIKATIVFRHNINSEYFPELKYSGVRVKVELD